MDEQDQKSFRCFMVCALLLLVTMFGSCQVTNYQIRRSIEAGAAPLTAKCAMSADSGSCAVLEAAEAEAQRQK